MHDQVCADLIGSSPLFYSLSGLIGYLFFTAQRKSFSELFVLFKSHNLLSAMVDGIFPLTSWKWEGIPLPKLEEQPDEPHLLSSIDLTSWVVNQLRTSRYNDVRDIIEGKKDLVRLIELKERRERGDKVTATIQLTRQQRFSSSAAYLVTEPTNKEPCQQCNSRSSSGPCALCIAGGPELFTGACTNCQYSSNASKYTFYAKK
ncbi:uncharacterized protein F4822DRAFT_406152 [Hypoxylon trugodes]|uniref:uncharacterized protein n=1 Tax=Hypoxylon trugodes TaxID=326681 RepID=UPI00218DF2CB|nr:uncharacterized protein F4822DRAFT_406152 [Hypoxylon trugodes]KAI1387326.1 hypothetical protein F4822DRAFT_406152 [Hypoxylon trugodes]